MKDFFCRLFTPWKAGAQFDAPEAFYGFLLGRDKLLGTIRNLCFAAALVLLVIGYAVSDGTGGYSIADIANQPYYLIAVGVMVLALLLSLFGMGINVGIDFSGGMSMQYTMGEAVTQSDIEGVLNGIGLKDYAVSVQGSNRDSINIRIKAIDEDGVQGVQASITEALQAKYPNAAIYGDVNYVGPVAGATLLRNAFFSGLVYSFVKAITAVSAIIFLVSPRWDLVTSKIYTLFDQAKYSQAAAFVTMMVVILLVFIGIFNGLINLLLAPRSRVPKGAGIHEKTEETK